MNHDYTLEEDPGGSIFKPFSPVNTLAKLWPPSSTLQYSQYDSRAQTLH
jgi:hypothetical protein